MIAELIIIFADPFVLNLGPNLDLLSTGAVPRSERFGKERMTMVNYNIS